VSPAKQNEEVSRRGRTGRRTDPKHAPFHSRSRNDLFSSLHSLHRLDLNDGSDWGTERRRRIGERINMQARIRFERKEGTNHARSGRQGCSLLPVQRGDQGRCRRGEGLISFPREGSWKQKSSQARPTLGRNAFRWFGSRLPTTQLRTPSHTALLEQNPRGDD